MKFLCFFFQMTSYQLILSSWFLLAHNINLLNFHLDLSSDYKIGVCIFLLIAYVLYLQEINLCFCQACRKSQQQVTLHLHLYPSAGLMKFLKFLMKSVSNFLQNLICNLIYLIVVRTHTVPVIKWDLYLINKYENFAHRKGFWYQKITAR